MTPLSQSLEFAQRALNLSSNPSSPFRALASEDVEETSKHYTRRVAAWIWIWDCGCDEERPEGDRVC
jgi:hypothetical protein